MKKRKYSNIPARWLWIWLIQIASMLALSLLSSLSFMLSAVVYNICMWVLMPVAGAYSACMATIKGLLNYAAWIAPWACMLFVHLLLYGYAPGLGMLALCAFVSLVGAAAGEVIRSRK